jgi:transposase
MGQRRGSVSGHRRLARSVRQCAELASRRRPSTSALSRWFQARDQALSGRKRKTTIVALARKLLVALWRYTSAGVVIEGAVMKTI